MPTYQYACTECGHDFEQFQKLSEDSLTECPECGGKLRKLFNAVGVVFKGSGFYRNDSRATSVSSDAPAASETKSGSDTKTETKTEKKAETKTESKAPAATAS